MHRRLRPCGKTREDSSKRVGAGGCSDGHQPLKRSVGRVRVAVGTQGVDRAEDEAENVGDKVSDVVEDMIPGDSDRDGH